jgi:hypothetical protein
MTKAKREVWLALEEAQSALAVIDSALAERLDADDRQQLDSLVDRARKALDRAQLRLSESVRAAQLAIESI